MRNKDNCIIAPYDRQKDYDDFFPLVIKEIRDKTTNPKKNDDVLIVFFGVTGSGKSMLMLHGYEEYSFNNVHLNNIALTKEDFANSLKSAKDSPKPRFCGYDEANINKRDSMTKFNKDVIDLYSSIRGLNIFHSWCNPSIDYLDSQTINEMIDGAFFVATKSTNKPRVYYYFRKEELENILHKYGSLKIPLIQKIAYKEAYYCGCFKDYHGTLRKEYDSKKSNRMNDKIEVFWQKYSNETYLKVSEVMQKLGISRNTLYKYTDILIENKQLNESQVIRTNNNHRKYTMEAFDIIRNHINNKT